MLTLLKIQNLALVDELLWEPNHGFIGITGETGAGKSVIMGGISLALGERADKGLIRSGEDFCSIEAVFQLDQCEAINRLLEEAGVPPCDEGALIIRRQMTAKANKQFINSSPVTLQLLKQVGAGLVDMHHPDSHRSLTSQDRQLSLLDAYAENAAEYTAYRTAYRAWSQTRSAYTDLQDSEMASERELDFLRHQIAEIEEADFNTAEVESLEMRWQRARNANRLRETAAPLLRLLDEDDASVLAQLRQVVRQSHDLERLDESVSSWIAPLPDVVEQLEDFAERVRDYAQGVDDDPSALAELENRIALLDTLKRKYGADWESISQHLEACRTQLAGICNREQELERLAQRVEQLYTEVLAAAAILSETRRIAAPKLAEDFLIHARDLGFRQSLFNVELKALEKLTPQGAEEIEFLFGPNPGEPLKALRLIASGGELARVMLALKSALAKQDDTPLLIFDEIDANVGGEIARAVGSKMRELGKDHQVIAITHFPQVAALADAHYLISKSVADGRSISRLNLVEDEARVAELVRMLGADGDAAHAHARDLLCGK